MSASPATTTRRVRLDRPRELRLTFLEALHFLEATGISIARDGLDLLDLDERQFCELVRCCACDPELTLEMVAESIDADNVGAVLHALADLVAAYMGHAPAEEGESADPLDGARESAPSPQTS